MSRCSLHWRSKWLVIERHTRNSCRLSEMRLNYSRLLLHQSRSKFVKWQLTIRSSFDCNSRSVSRRSETKTKRDTKRHNSIRGVEKRGRLESSRTARPKPPCFFATIAPFTISLHFTNWTPETSYNPTQDVWSSGWTPQSQSETATLAYYYATLSAKHI